MIKEKILFVLTALFLISCVENTENIDKPTFEKFTIDYVYSSSNDEFDTLLVSEDSLPGSLHYHDFFIQGDYYGGQFLPFDEAFEADSSISIHAPNGNKPKYLIGRIKGENLTNSFIIHKMGTYTEVL